MKIFTELRTACMAFSIAVALLAGCNNSNRDELLAAYTLAKNTGDMGAATDLAYLVLAQDTNNLAWKDTLATLYYIRGGWAAVNKFGNQVLAANPNDTNMLVRVATARFELGEWQPAMADYQKLQQMRPSTAHAYRIAVCQFNLNDAQGAFATANGVVGNPSSSQEATEVIVNDESGNPRSQLVPTLAAALNLQGYILLRANQPDQAKTHFVKAIEAYPDFRLAVNNLASVDRPLAEATLKRIQQLQASQQGAGGPLGGGQVPGAAAVPSGVAPSGQNPPARR